MSSGSKKTTIGYWFRLLYQFGFCKGPIDAFLEFRAGDRIAWKGLQTISGRISINKPNLFGGEKSEGGLVGDFDVMMGEATQQPNDYLAAQLGSDQPAYRGKATGVWRGGRWGAINPYPKPAAFKVRRILKGWDNDAPWYPEKAAIGVLGTEPLALYMALDLSGSMAGTKLSNMKTAVNAVLQLIADAGAADGLRVDIMIVGWNTGTAQSILRRSVTSAGIAELQSWVSGREASAFTDFASGLQAMAGFFAGAAGDAARVVIFITDGIPDAGTDVTAKALIDAEPGVMSYGINIDLTDTSHTALVDNTPDDGVPVVQGGDPTAMTNVIVGAMSSLMAMNPAHILYDSLTAADMQHEPTGMINDASFRAAADKLYSESFGLCTVYEGGSIEEFQQRVCDIIGGSLTQSRVDGQYYLDLIRGDYVLETLPVVTADDIVEFSQEPSILTEQPNQVSVEWFDPQEKLERTTAPLQALGAIQAAGGVTPETRTYREIASEALALRVGARDLQALATPTSRFSLTLNRRIFDLRPGRSFRLQYPAEGLGDMVCVLGDIDTGTLKDGRIRIVAVQDVYGFPATVYVGGESGLAQPPSTTPEPSPHQLLLEAPFVELIVNLSRADLAALPSDIGMVMTAATRSTAGLNYAVHTAADGEDYAAGGNAEWCPTALITEAAGYLDTAFTLTAGIDLGDVLVGTWAQWDSEIVRVDALDAMAGTITLGRGCADTIPAQHLAGSRIFFCGDWAGTDGREYVDGETVRARLLTRTSTDEQLLADAQELSITLAQRQFRPYPPGQFKINGLDYPEGEPFGSAVAVSWAHRDRLLQDDKLFDASAGSIGPEPGVQYYVRVTALDAALLPLGEALDVLVDGSAHSVLASDITASAYAEAPYFRIGVRATRDGIESWAEPSIVVTGLLQAPTNLTAVAETY